jgi:hypothetical protein
MLVVVKMDLKKNIESKVNNMKKNEYQTKYGQIYSVGDGDFVLEKNYNRLDTLFENEPELRACVRSKGFKIINENICLSVEKKKNPSINFIHKLELEYVF